jgi:hypothetical protein
MATLERLERWLVESVGTGLLAVDVRDDRQWRHDDASAGNLGTPGQLEVFGHGDDRLIEPRECFEQITADERGPARGNEDVSDDVVLAVVNLSWCDALTDRTGAIGLLANVQEHPIVVVRDVLWRHDSGVLSHRSLDHLGYSVWCKHDIVVAEEEERGPIDH